MSSPSFLKKIKPKSSLKELINDNVGGYSKPRSQKGIHASALTKEVEYCPREIALMQLLDVTYKNEWIPTQLQLTFDEGNDKQGRINNDYLQDFMAGPWKCRSCDNEVEWYVGKPTYGCCKKPYYEYEEAFLLDPDSGAQGALDGLISFPGIKLLRLAEIKIMALSMFEKLKAPLAEHKLRTELYLYLLDVSGMAEKHGIGTKSGNILYCLRGHGKKDETGSISPLKEFVIQRNDDNIKYLIDKAKAVTTFRKLEKTGVVKVPTGICPSMDCKRSKSCQVRKQCFSGKYK